MPPGDAKEVSVHGDRWGQTQTAQGKHGYAWVKP